jgi:hypothetical protein
MTRLLCTSHGCPRCWEEGYAAGLRTKLPPSATYTPVALQLALTDPAYVAVFTTPADYRAALLRFLPKGDA